LLVAACTTSRLQDDFDTTFLLVPEDAITLRRIFQRESMRDNERRVDLALLDAIEEPVHIALHMGWPVLIVMALFTLAPNGT
jgi:hypothetical protein